MANVRFAEPEYEGLFQPGDPYIECEACGKRMTAEEYSDGLKVCFICDPPWPMADQKSFGPQFAGSEKS